MESTGRSDNSATCLVTGAQGQLGMELSTLIPGYPGLHGIFCTKADLDITDEKCVQQIFKTYQPEFVINCAAYTRVDDAENASEKAFLVNAKAVENLVNAIRAQDATLIQISTDYVYHNALRRPLLETDPTNPKSVYARSKLAGEQAALAYEKSVVIRTSWLYSSHGHNFVRTISRLCQQGRDLKVVADQTGAPTYARDLALAILEIISQHTGPDSRQSSQTYGVFNYANSGETNWYAYARYIRAYLNASCTISPVSTAEYDAPAPRPPYSVLDCTKIKKTFGTITTPEWRHSLEACLSILYGDKN